MMREYYKKFWQNIRLLSLFVLIFSFWMSGCSFSGSFGKSIDKSHKSDAELLTHFQKHQTEFNQLHQMLTEDKEVSDNFELIFSGYYKLPKERVEEYRKLMLALKLPTWISIRRDYKTKEIKWIEIRLSQTEQQMTNWSLVVQKSYKWLKEPPEKTKLSDCLDQYHTEVESKTKYRYLEGNWYLEIRDWVEDDDDKDHC